MSYRRIAQLRAARSAATSRTGIPRHRPRAADRAVRTVRVPVPAAASRPRQDTGAAEGDGQRGGLDWARRIELVSVIIASLVAVAGLWYSNVEARQQRATEQEGQITDRYTAAVENLGDDAMDVRLGGIYALQRIMQDSVRDHPTIVNVLTAYVRGHAPLPNDADQDTAGTGEQKRSQQPEPSEPDADVQAALSVLAFRDTTHDGDRTRIDLHRANLGRAELFDANLRDADLGGAHLHRAYLHRADLRDAHLVDADLRDAHLHRAYLGDADLHRAYLGDADLRDAHLSGAYLGDAELFDANLRDADLFGADLSGADLSDSLVSAKQVAAAQLDESTKLSPEIASDQAVQERIAQVTPEG